MAGPTWVKIRLWNPGRDCIWGDTSHVLPHFLEKPYLDTGKNRRFLEIFWVGATQAAAGEELGTAAVAKDGVTTPFQITVDCVEANDTDATTGDARKVAIIGVSVSSIGAYNAGETPVLGVEVINLNGITAVTSVRYYLRLIHGYVCDWGSGGADAKGDITIESPAVTVLQSILATYNEANGGILYFADGDQVRPDYIRLGPTEHVIADGITFRITASGFDHTLNVDADDALNTYTHVAGYVGDAVYRNAWVAPKRATSTAKLTLSEELIATTLNYQIHCTVLVGKE